MRVVRNILVMSFTHIGDATLSTAVVEPLRRAHPNARITFFVGEKAAPLLEPDPAIDAVIAYRRDLHRGFRGRLRLIRVLRAGRYDFVVDLRDAAYARFLGGRRIGLRDYGRRHAVRRYLDALDAAGIPTEGARPRLTLTPEERDAATRWLAERGVRPGAAPLVGIHPGGNWTYKLWDPKRFAAVADALAERHGARLLLFAGPGEKPLLDAVVDSLAHEALPVEGVSLRLLAGLIAACDLYVGNDTGPMHIADAVGTPVVALFEPTDDVRSGPFGEEHAVIRSGIDLGCNPCHPGRRPGGCGKGVCEALNAIDVETVVAAADRILSA